MRRLIRLLRWFMNLPTPEQIDALDQAVELIKSAYSEVSDDGKKLVQLERDITDKIEARDAMLVRKAADEQGLCDSVTAARLRLEQITGGKVLKPPGKPTATLVSERTE